MTVRQAIGGMLYTVTPGSWRVFCTMRREVEAVVRRARNRFNPEYQRRVFLLRNMKGLSLNLGSGGKGKDGWVNADLQAYKYDNGLPLDIRKPLPFADGSAKRIMAEHVVEHLDYHYEVPNFLKECYRVLEPGGVLRVVVPDAEQFCIAYVLRKRPGHFAGLGWDLNFLPATVPTPMAIVNHVFHQGGEHQFGWDYETMELSLMKAGFQEQELMGYKESLDPELAIDQENHRAYSLYVDARK
jgi:predicted SAM-dependent methyltransferase